MRISAYRVMWLFVLFDLPVVTIEDRREYTRFRKKVLALGFGQLQFSVYAKHLPSEEDSERLKTHIMAALPPSGEVRLLAVTDRQFDKMEVYRGRRRRATESPPLQISLF